MAHGHVIRKYFGYGLSWLLRLSLLGMCFSYLFYGDIVGAVLFMATFALSLTPIFLNQVYNARMHWTFDFFVSFMIFMHMSGFIGMYNLFPIWDDFAHLLGSCALTLIGFAIIYTMNISGRVKVSLAFMGVFAFLWTMGLGGVWEIIEFLWDNTVMFAGSYGFAQNGLVDTMIDLSWDMVAGVLVAVGSVYFVKHASQERKERMFGPFVRIFTHQKGIKNSLRK
jgi:hypothetical protein